MVARILRGKGDFNSTFRVAGFAQSAHVLELLNFLPVIGPLGRFMAVLLTTFGIWVGMGVAHELKGWRTLLLPVVYILTIIISFFFILVVIESVPVTFNELMQAFGLIR